MAVQTEQQVLHMGQMTGDAGVVNHENFTSKEEQVGNDGVADNFCQGLHGFPAWVKFGEFSNNVTKDDQKRRTCSKGRCQESGGQDGRQPEPTTGQTAVQVCGYCMDADGKGDGNIHKRFCPPHRFYLVSFSFKYLPAHNNVQKQIPVENNHVIKEHGVGGGVQEHIQHTDGLT